MKNIILTTAICAGSIVMTGMFVNNKFNECSGVRTALLPKEIKAVASQTTPKAEFASAFIPEKKAQMNSTSLFFVATNNLLDDQVKSDEEINDDFEIENLPVIHDNFQSDDEMNVLFQSENAELKMSSNTSASDAEMNDHFLAENK